MPLQFSTRSRRTAVALTAVAAALTSVAVAAPAHAAADPTLTDSYDAVGTSHIGSINADLPIAPTKLIETVDLINFNIINGSLPIAPQVVSFKALGFIPLRATVTLVETSPITGKLTLADAGNTLSAKVSYTIKLSNVQVLVGKNWLSLGVGNSCQTISPITIAVSSPAGQYFDIADGGTVTGKYTIGNFQNCAPLNLPDVFGVGSLPVNALVPGTNNTVSITLANGTYVSST